MQYPLVLHSMDISVRHPIPPHAIAARYPRSKKQAFKVRAARLQNETATKSVLIPKREAKRKARNKKFEERPETSPKNVKLCLSKKFSPALFHSFAPAMSNAVSTTISKLFLQQESAGVALLRKGDAILGCCFASLPLVKV